MQHVPLSIALACGIALPLVAAEQSLNGHVFTVPDGFTVNLVAPSSMVPRPVSGSFDSEGVLYVTDSSGSNLPPSEQIKNPDGRILRLEDKDHDGVFETASVYADRVMFPQGCLWHAGSVYVAGPPSIWKFTDTDNDGVADKREEWYRGNVLTGCANDVHGPYLGPEGKIYWTKGAFARLDLKDYRGRPIHDRCAHLFRARPDGSGLESIMSGGMDNPVELAFTMEGEPIVIGTFFDLSQPGRRDGLIHAVYGGVFGKMNDVVDEPMVVRTGDLLPTMTHYGPAAACALTRYDGEQFGPEYRHNLFATLFNLHKVTRHVLVPKGASYQTVDSDFMVSDHLDFHPTDVLEDADGSLLVIDTGGWYKLCCPSSQLAKADVLGGIYRVRRGSDPRPVPNPTQRRAAYVRLSNPPPLAPDSQVARMKKTAVTADPATASELREALTKHLGSMVSSPASAHTVRVAAEGLGRMQSTDALPSLFEAIRVLAGADRFLEHSLLFAIVEIDDARAVQPFLKSDDKNVQRAALLALDQIEGHKLVVSDITSLLTSDFAPLRQTTEWIIRRHPEWGEALAGHFRQRLSTRETSDAEKQRWEKLLVLLARSPQAQAFLTEAATETAFRTETRVAALEAMSNASRQAPPEGWRAAAIQLLNSTESSSDSVRSAAIRLAGVLANAKEGRDEIASALHRIARDTRHPASVRIDALTALPAGSGVDGDEAKLLQAALDPFGAPRERLSAASTLSRIKLQPDQLTLLLPALETAGPLELPRLLPAFAVEGSESLGKQMLAALKKSKALRSLRSEDLKSALARYPESTRNAADELLTAIAAEASLDRNRLESLKSELAQTPGEVRRGQAIFNSAKAACSSCHRLGYLGGDIGPDLTAIGTVRTETDLLEALLYPSASFVRSYEPWIASCKDGEQYSGVLRHETPDEIVLATGPGAEVRVPRSNLEELRPGSVSIMPAGLEEQLSRQDLADLIAFLKNTKWGVN